MAGPAWSESLVIGAALLAAALVAPQAFGGDAPVLQLYDRYTGTTAIGRIENLGFTQLPNPGQLAPGWIEIVTLPDTHRFAYNTNEGAGAVIYLDDRQEYVTAKSYPPHTFIQGWSHVVPIGGERVFFYRDDNGRAAVQSIAFDGTVTPIRFYGPPSPNAPLAKKWWSIIHPREGVLFHNGATGTGEFGAFASDGTFELKKEYGDLPRRCTIVYVEAVDLLLFYNAPENRVELGRIDAAGNIVMLKTHTIDGSYSSVVPTENGGVFFYAMLFGDAGHATLTRDGGFQFGKFPDGTFGPEWTSVTYGR